MTRSIDNEETWKSHIDWNIILNFINMTSDIFWWEESSTNLLSDTTGFSSLNGSFSKFIKNQSFTSIDVTHDTDNWASEFSSSIFILLVFSSSNFSHVFCSSSYPLSFGFIIIITSTEDISCNLLFFNFLVIFLLSFCVFFFSCFFVLSFLNCSFKIAVFFVTF